MSRALTCRHKPALGRLLSQVHQSARLSRRLSASSIQLTSSSVNAGNLRFGQPLHETHPHVLESSELTPGITALEYAQRRTKLAAQLPANAVAIVAASDVVYRTGHVFYDFHQDPDFFYLTGFSEPEALAVIGSFESVHQVAAAYSPPGKDSSGKDHTFHLFVREKDPKAEIWDGARSGTQAALDVFNADETGDIGKVKSLLGPIIEDISYVYTDIANPPTYTSTFLEFLRGPSPRLSGFCEMLEAKKVKPLRQLMNDLRVTKSPAEIQNMRKAGQASGRAFTEAMGSNFDREKHVDAFLTYRFKMNGCDRAAFEPVAAGGDNALSIHYVRNDAVLRSGDLVLGDAGGEYGGYVSDITRTWPVNGTFSAAQRDLYEVVLNVQRGCIKECRESTHTSLELLHQKAEKELKEGLKQIGFDMSSDAIHVLLPHHLSHYVGLDLHDCIGYSKKATLKAGQCITIEPGIYVPFNDDRFPRHFQGIGVRIEDSVCVGEAGPVVLTAEAVKEVADIEALKG